MSDYNDSESNKNKTKTSV